VGGNDEVPFDVRLITSTNRDIESAVEEGRFREDLYFRINVISVEMPPLRARGGDVLLLAQHFIDRYAAQAGKRIAGISPEAAERLLAYVWPGNVRELENCIERAIALARHEAIGVEDLPEKIRRFERSHVLVTSDDASELVPLEAVEQRYVLRVMEAVGAQTFAARVLGSTARLCKPGYKAGGARSSPRGQSFRPHGSRRHEATRRLAPGTAALHDGTRLAPCSSGRSEAPRAWACETLTRTFPSRFGPSRGRPSSHTSHRPTPTPRRGPHAGLAEPRLAAPSFPLPAASAVAEAGDGTPDKPGQVCPLRARRG
jgi:hypothetical protein